jgi:glyoxylase-like metal-dependent hydrolase (beta-lactamase superfamily II)
MPEPQAPQPIEAVKISETSYRLEDTGVRSFLFVGSERALLVDTGFGSAGSLKDVVSGLTSLPVMLVNTHGDPDHIGNNAEFDTAYMHPSEMAYYAKHAKPGAVVEPLFEGEVIDLGGWKFEIVLIPGHTPGSIALLERSRRFIITGDTLSAGPVFMFDEVRSIPAYMASMDRLIALSEAYDEVYPSHGQFPIPPETAQKALLAAKKLLAGELTAQDPPMPVPAKVYMHDGVGFFY